MTTPTNISVGAAIPGEQFAAAAAAIFKFADSIFLTLNSPEMLALRQREDIQALLQASDDTLKAAQGGDKAARAKLDEEVTG